MKKTEKTEQARAATIPAGRCVYADAAERRAYFKREARQTLLTGGNWLPVIFSFLILMFFTVGIKYLHETVFYTAELTRIRSLCRTAARQAAPCERRYISVFRRVCRCFPAFMHILQAFTSPAGLQARIKPFGSETSLLITAAFRHFARLTVSFSHIFGNSPPRPASFVCSVQLGYNSYAQAVPQYRLFSSPCRSVPWQLFSFFCLCKQAACGIAPAAALEILRFVTLEGKASKSCAVTWRKR